MQQQGWEVIILSEVNQTEKDSISYDIAYMWNLKNETNELMYKTEIDSQTEKINVWLSKGKGVGEKDKLRVWN